MTKIFLDLEMNPISRTYDVNRRLLRREIIQIGAIALDENDEVVGEFSQFIKPEYSISVAPRIFHLTGITTDMVNQGCDFEEAIMNFAIWCEDVSQETSYEIFAWSDNDLIQLQREMLYKEKTEFFDMEVMNVWTDFQYIFCDLIGIDSVISLDCIFWRT